jgi:hypothetical protein
MANARWQLPSWPVYALLTAAVLAAVGWFRFDHTLDNKDLGTGLLALLGTFAGALLAFRLEESRERAKQIAAQKAALNRALLVLGYHHNEIRTYCDLISPYQLDIELAFNFPASEPPDHSHLRQHPDELNFLLDSSDPQVLFDLIIEQNRFDQAMQAIHTRNVFYVEQVQPAFARAGLNNRRVSDVEIKAGLGEYLYGGALHGAQTLKDHLHASNDSLPALATKLRAIAKQLYPDERFVSFQTIALPNERAAAAAAASSAPA